MSTSQQRQLLIAGGVAAAALGALFLLGRARGGNGGGDGGASTSTGTVTSVTVNKTQALNAEQIDVDYSLQISTVDFEGNFVVWPYRWEISMENTVTGAVAVGPRLLNEGDFGPTTISEFNGIFTPDFAQPGETYVVVVSLFAAASDASGNPIPGSKILLDSLDSEVITII